VKVLLFVGVISAIIYSISQFDIIETKVAAFANWSIKKKGEEYYIAGLVFILGEILFLPRSMLAAGSGLILR
jgi:hypothetical protein